MAKFGEGVPLSALGANLTASIARLRKDVTALNKTVAMKIVASLNLLTGDEVIDKTQNRALSLMRDANLIDDISYRKIELHIRKRRNEFIVFHRTHAFELFRALLLWASESGGTSVFLNPKAQRNSLIRAILLSLHVQDERLIPATLVAEQDMEKKSFGMLPIFRAMSLMQPGVSNPLAILGRAKTLMDKHFYTTEFLEHKERFEQASKMTLSDYRTAATLILLLEYMAQPSVKNLATDFVFKIDDICKNAESLRPSTERYLALESSTVSDLSNQFQTQTGTEFLNVRYFREKPILSLPDEEYISLDLALLADRATYGPLFFVQGKGTRNKFQDFGKAFELYVYDIALRQQSPWGCTSIPLYEHCAHPGTAAGKGDELSDLTLSDGTTCILFQVKGVWLEDESVSWEPDIFWKKVQEKYSTGGSKGKKKGMGQLASAIKKILDGSLQEKPPFILNHKKIFPVLLCHDPHMVIPYYGYFLAKEFWQHFSGSSLPSTGRIVVNGFEVFSPIICSVVEIEQLDQVNGSPNIFSTLENYNESDPLRQGDLRQFLSKQNLSVETHAMKAGDEVLNAISLEHFGTGIKSRYQLDHSAK